MSESPPDPPPILSYATPEPRVPVYLVVILYLWAVFAVLGGPLFSLSGLAVYLGIMENGQGFGLALSFGCPLCFVGPGLVVWGGIMFMLTNRMQRHQVAALQRAASLMIVAEIFAWVWAGIFLVAVVVLSGINLDWPMVLFFVGIAVAASVTRMLLRRAVKRMPTWES